MTEIYWSYNVTEKKYIQSYDAPSYKSCTILNKKDKTLWCKTHKRWERITKIFNSKATSECGMLFSGPYIQDQGIFINGYSLKKNEGLNSYRLTVLAQKVSITGSRKKEVSYTFLPSIGNAFCDNKRSLGNGNFSTIKYNKSISESLPTLPENVANEIANEIGTYFEKVTSVKPRVSCKINGMEKLLAYTALPYNANFYMIAGIFGLNVNSPSFFQKIDRFDLNGENEMFKALDLKPTKTLRKKYQEVPASPILYKILSEAGFTNINVINRLLTQDFWEMFEEFFVHYDSKKKEISYAFKDNFEYFCKDVLKNNKEPTIQNCLKKTVADAKGRVPRYGYSRFTTFVDCLAMYRNPLINLTDKEKRDILHDGFTEYIHDVLLKRLGYGDLVENPYSFMQKNINEDENDYEYSDTVKKLEGVYEDDKSFYHFVLPQNPFEVRAIGSSMHNCVGFCYTEAIREKRSIILAVYVTGSKNNTLDVTSRKWKICIELSKSFSLRQALGPCNDSLNPAMQLVLERWMKDKKIK